MSEQHGTLKDLAKSMQTVETAKLSNLIDGIHSELAIITNNVVLEIVFKEYFLDFFFNMAKFENNEVLILKWLELSGGPFREVDIIDSNGNTVITIPALYERPEIDYDTMNKKDFSEIAGNFHMKLNRFHAEGINYLNTELKSVGNNFSKPTSIATARWKAVYDYYYPSNKALSMVDKLKNPNVTQDMYDFK